MSQGMFSLPDLTVIGLLSSMTHLSPYISSTYEATFPSLIHFYLKGEGSRCVPSGHWHSTIRLHSDTIWKTIKYVKVI